MKRLSFVLFGAFLGLLLVQGAVYAERVTVCDMGKRTVEISSSAQRIICLSPGTLRQIVYLGASDRVVGVEEFEKTRPSGRPYILAHPELTKLPTIGPGGPGSINKEPDLEAVLSVRPDVIFISYMEPSNADALQKKLGIPVVILSHGRFASFDALMYDSLRVAGKVLNAEQQAEKVISYIENARKDLQSRTEGIAENQKPTVYIGALGYKGIQGIESTDPSYTPLDWVRAKNLAKTVSQKDHLFTDKEKLLSWNPDIIFIDAGGLSLVKQDFQKKPEFYKELRAFRENKVFVVYPFNYYVTNISTAVADAYAIGKILYPDRFADVDIQAKSDEIYGFLYGKPLYKAMEESYGPLGSLLQLN
ncbi:iron ABC transporter substrate-binding protein [Desulfomonile tiedjei]|uniref:ABC-type Fe3+-hydroxamate transport system, periplasmic component n=1 Tax=Desulfomonile tiedjei (strain ATCC 49306 / DSM 6799 / DCB-1) TaxID=706587 RepID=I4C5R6_DESTA|nr:iron ABC transporter substrate-binding protein [Desulfomonile tiedjei]AFM24907.1 ABC-type Fe3+-hydroxamate transport system, periplasmic component [Desulfomonile tiedjei DSM 6799]